MYGLSKSNHKNSLLGFYNIVKINLMVSHLIHARQQSVAVETKELVLVLGTQNAGKGGLSSMILVSTLSVTTTGFSHRSRRTLLSYTARLSRSRFQFHCQVTHCYNRHVQIITTFCSGKQR